MCRLRQYFENLQGRIVVRITPVRAPASTPIVPVSLAMTRVLLVSTGPELYALPLASIEKIIGIRSTFSVEGQTMITVDGRPLPLISLGAALRRPLSNALVAGRHYGDRRTTPCPAGR